MMIGHKSIVLLVMSMSCVIIQAETRTIKAYKTKGYLWTVAVNVKQGTKSDTQEFKRTSSKPFTFDTTGGLITISAGGPTPIAGGVPALTQESKLDKFGKPQVQDYKTWSGSVIKQLGVLPNKIIAGSKIKVIANENGEAQNIEIEVPKVKFSKISIQKLNPDIAYLWLNKLWTISAKDVDTSGGSQNMGNKTYNKITGQTEKGLLNKKLSVPLDRDFYVHVEALGEANKMNLLKVGTVKKNSVLTVDGSGNVDVKK